MGLLEEDSFFRWDSWSSRFMVPKIRKKEAIRVVIDFRELDFF
jgi:hypothetical protein